MLAVWRMCFVSEVRVYGKRPFWDWRLWLPWCFCEAFWGMRAVGVCAPLPGNSVRLKRERGVDPFRPWGMAGDKTSAARRFAGRLGLRGLHKPQAALRRRASPATPSASNASAVGSGRAAKSSADATPSAYDTETLEMPVWEKSPIVSVVKSFCVK